MKALSRALLSSVAVWVAVPAGLGEEVGSMFREIRAHSGVYAEPAPANLSVRWAFHTAEAIVSSPTVAGGMVYFGSSDNFLYAVDAASDPLRWKFDAHGNVGSSPAVNAGAVYFASLDGSLYALDAASGKKKWSFATEGERRHTGAGMDYASALRSQIMPDPWDFFLSSPVVAEGTVYFGSGDAHVYAVDAATGALRWKTATGGVVHSSPAVSGGMVYVGCFDTRFYALDAATGAVRWTFRTQSDDQAHLMTGTPGSPCVANGVVYFGSRDAHIYALDASTGAPRWIRSTDGSWVVSTPAVLDGRVYVTTSDSLKFLALDARTGADLFSLSYGTYAFSSPSIAGGRAYFGTFDGKVHEVDLASRTFSGEFSVPDPGANRARYLDKEGKLVASAVWTGDTLDDTIVDLRSKVFSMGSVLSSPAIAAGVLYFGSTDGTLYALGR